MNANEHERRLIDIPTAADRLNLGVSTVRRKINAGEIPAYRMGGPGSVIRLDRWLREPEHAA